MTDQSNVLSALSNDMADAVEQAGKALVLVNGRQRQPASGVVFGQNLVLTADHVLEREDNLTILTEDNRTLAAQFAGRDSSSDLAVLRVDGVGIDPAAPASAEARVGQLVLAVGRPSSNGVMASLGIVSGVGGPLRTRRGGMLERFIQTDATPYPGFSGGPLIGSNGAVLGLTTTGLIGGVTLAIPSVIAWRIGETIANQGYIKRGYLGISSQPVQIPEAQRAGREQDHGLLIVRVEDNSPAQQGGLLLGDILVALDGQTVTDTDDLQALLAGERVDTTVPVEVLRGGNLQTLQVQIGRRS
ncbi:MAG TPA: trypsin-like peptidase domain-containing protein [Roseiflexaceae bacterium]|jgi:S1-C subfamily serine protease|nr:trypsin-like peptidase domain-containing protein [Roseiflexaceae bacterium]